jgi:hypothetical protein
MLISVNEENKSNKVPANRSCFCQQHVKDIAPGDASAAGRYLGLFSLLATRITRLASYIASSPFCLLAREQEICWHTTGGIHSLSVIAFSLMSCVLCSQTFKKKKKEKKEEKIHLQRNLTQVLTLRTRSRYTVDAEISYLWLPSLTCTTLTSHFPLWTFPHPTRDANNSLVSCDTGICITGIYN